jgi:hypothetical protein
MTSVGIDSKERVGAAWENFGAAVPARRPETANVTSTDKGSASAVPLLRTGLRFLRNAAIGLSLCIAVPIAVVAFKGPNIMLATAGSLTDRLTDIERMRPYAIRKLAVPGDPAITPLQAGRALHRLQSGKPTAAFPVHDAGVSPARPWKTLAMTPDMFRDIGQDFTVRNSARIITAVRDGVSAQELAWLKSVSEAPIWVHFDMVARAPAVDVIGGQFKLPFREDASAIEAPIARFQDTKELANAALARAAYYMAIGNNDEAEQVLRTVVSFGFAYIDNASHSLDALVGRVLVEIGRDGLEQFFLVTGRPVLHGKALERVTFSSIQPNKSPRPDAQTMRAQLLASAANPELSRGLRLESLRGLSFGVCTNVGEMLTGHSAEVSEAFRTARTSLARYPSERAFLDLMLQSPNRIPPLLKGSLSDRLVAGAGEIAATILRNPRISGCTRIALANSD